MRWKDVHSDDLLAHLVVVGRGDRGPMWGRVLKNARLPVVYVGLDAELDEQVLELPDKKRYGPELSDNGELLSDVGLFYRGPSPFRRQRTLTMCHGMFSSGTLSVARSLLDDEVAPRNISHLDVARANGNGYLVLLRIQIFEGESVTPDWDVATIFEWRGTS